MQIPIDGLQADTLRRVVEEFVTREGTDYGVSSAELSQKVDQVIRQLKKGEAILLFDQDSESCHIVSKSQFADTFKKKRASEHDSETRS
jgi:uncharacterized protein YheU (UPF0270 family)